jgi:hypothetical protein
LYVRRFTQTMGSEVISTYTGTALQKCCDVQVVAAIVAGANEVATSHEVASIILPAVSYKYPRYNQIEDTRTQLFH